MQHKVFYATKMVGVVGTRYCGKPKCRSLNIGMHNAKSVAGAWQASRFKSCTIYFEPLTGANDGLV